MTNFSRLLAIAAATAALALPAEALASAQSPPDSRFKVVLARVVTSQSKHRLLIRVKGPAKTVKIRVTLERGPGRVIRAVVRTVRTNRRLLVPRLVIPRSTRQLHVRILGHVG
jgi:hypothetical protein